MMRDLSHQNYVQNNYNIKGGQLVFDLQTKRPEFSEYAPTVKPHDNRFLNLNINSLAFSKN